MRFPGRRRRLVRRRFFEGELEKIPSPKKEKAPSPPVLKKKEEIDSSSEEEGEEDEWPKHLASFQVNAVYFLWNGGEAGGGSEGVLASEGRCDAS